MTHWRRMNYLPILWNTAVHVALNLWRDVTVLPWLRLCHLSASHRQCWKAPSINIWEFNVCLSYLKDVWCYYTFFIYNSAVPSSSIATQLHWVTCSFYYNEYGLCRALPMKICSCGNMQNLWTAWRYFALISVYIIKLAIGFTHQIL